MKDSELQSQEQPQVIKKEWIKPEMEIIEISSFGGGGSEAITGGRS